MLFDSFSAETTIVSHASSSFGKNETKVDTKEFLRIDSRVRGGEDEMTKVRGARVFLRDSALLNLWWQTKFLNCARMQNLPEDFSAHILTAEE